ncbi:MAG TPA: phosphodiester glycosidase family protein [Pseudomonadales bacterium]|nr:phosphodiester glycosidase family protein [Pseudomonadales bacterium]
MAWKLQSLLWVFLPEDRAVNLSLYFFILLLMIFLFSTFISLKFKKYTAKKISMVLMLATLISWVFLYINRPAWLVASQQENAGHPDVSELNWESPSDGLQVSELRFKVAGKFVDRMVLARLDPSKYKFSVHFDPHGSKTAEDWQEELGATIVVNGSYFGENFAPLTPIRASGVNAGPLQYISDHGAIVANESSVQIIDLRKKDVFLEINQYQNAMVSYPLLLDKSRSSTAKDSKTWLASRNFVALDSDGFVVFGATETGFFTIYNLAKFLEHGPLNLRLALNLDGGPLVSQIISSGSYRRNFHGTAEISNSNDVLRALWHSTFKTNWKLPIVLVANHVSSGIHNEN